MRDSEVQAPAVAATPRHMGAADVGARDHVGVSDVVRILRRRWWIVLTLTALVTTAAVLYIRVLQEPLYRATATLRMVDMRRPITTGITDAELPQDQRLISPQLSQAQLLTSRSLIGKTVDSLGLRLRPVFIGFAARLLSGVHVDLNAAPDTLFLAFSDSTYQLRGRSSTSRAHYGQPVETGGVRFTVLGRPRQSRASWPLVSREEAIDIVLQNLQVTPRPMTDVVDVAYTGYRPWLAQQFVNLLIDAHHDLDVSLARDQAHLRRVFVEARLAEAESLLVQHQLALAMFRRRAHVYSSRDKLAAEQNDLLTMETQRSVLVANRAMFDSLVRDLRTARSGPGGGAEVSGDLGALISSQEIAADPAVSQFYRRLVEYRAQRDSLTIGPLRAAASDPAVRRLDELIMSTRANIEAAVRGHVAALDARIAALSAVRDQIA